MRKSKIVPRKRVSISRSSPLNRKINTRADLATKRVLPLPEISLFQNEILKMLQLCLEQRNTGRKGLFEVFALFFLSLRIEKYGKDASGEIVFEAEMKDLFCFLLVVIFFGGLSRT